ncbi:MAG: DUF1385 domain-containing protein [Firmicutes bacterium]|nr:DUF1385 domain-containing protein [Bacillota bacterium]
MMRGPRCMAVAVRRPDGGIALEQRDLGEWLRRWPWARLPLVRGLVTLAESLALGFGALMFSAGAASEEEDPLTPGQMRWTVVAATAAGLGLFVVLPTWLIGLLRHAVPSSLGLNLIEGAVRLGILWAYLYAISRTAEIQRVLQYHGAEHKAIAAFEAGLPLTVENAARQSRFHPRCGTSYLLFVALVAVALFALLGWPSLLWRILSRLVLLPVVAGLAYELLRLSARHETRLWARWVAAPGLWMQRLTTREPDAAQLEVAIAALAAVLDREERLAG